MKPNKAVVITAIILATTMYVSCAVNRRPQQGPSPDTVRLKIPESISRGQRKEPVLKVYIKETGDIRQLPFEEYVAGVVAGEIKNDWPLEAMAAQAILARTFVMEFITEKGGSKYDGAHVSTDIEEAQAWNEKAINDRIKEAVKRTRGQVVVYKGDYIKAWFHSHAGGKTASAKEGLAYEKEEPPYIRVVTSPDSTKAPADDAEWTARFTKQQVIEAINQAGGSSKGFDSAKVSEKGPSGRAVTLAFGDTKVSAPNFRIAIGSTKMKSTLLTSIEVKGNSVVFKGKGYGHGVGMSQWGAFAMAEDGKKAENIIAHYFKGVEIAKAWD
jgi:stage II sporulation protein D